MSERPEEADAGGQGTPDEEEYRRALEEEMSKADVRDLIVQSAVGIVNLTARRIAVEDERDLDQAKAGIDAAEALLPSLPEQVQGQVRDAISQLQLQYAQLSGAGGSEPGGSEPPGGSGPASGGSSGEPTGGGGATGGGKSDRPGGLWTPPGAA